MFNKFEFILHYFKNRKKINKKYYNELRKKIFMNILKL